ncbi:hypothetical protein [Ponticoccus alexandrii]
MIFADRALLLSGWQSNVRIEIGAEVIGSISPVCRGQSRRWPVFGI